MTRVLLFCLKIALLVALAYWLAERPGEVSIAWLGHRLDTSVGLLLVAIAGLAVLAAMVYRFWRFLYRAPRSAGRALETGRRRRGYKALTQGLVAVAAGEAAEAARLAKKADGLLGDPPLTMLLSAQAAQLDGDQAAAKRYFQAMLDDPETRFLGLRGLLTVALREGDREAALTLARQAHALRPNTPWVLTSLFDLSQGAGDLEAAERALTEAAKIKALPAPEAARKRAVLLLERALAARDGGTPGEARKLAGRALRLAPGLVPAGVFLAEDLIASGRGAKAERVLEKTWAAAPHPDLARLYGDTRSGETELARLKRLGTLIAGRKAHPESHLALARANLAAKLWGETRRHLTAAAGPEGLEGRPREGICRLLAELAAAEAGDDSAARAWLARAATAPADPGWVCGTCGALSDRWDARCGACGTFDGLVWETPPRVTSEIQPLGSLPAIETPAAAPKLPEPKAAETRAQAETKPPSAQAPAVRKIPAP